MEGRESLLCQEDSIDLFEPTGRLQTRIHSNSLDEDIPSHPVVIEDRVSIVWTDAPSSADRQHIHWKSTRRLILDRWMYPKSPVVEHNPFLEATVGRRWPTKSRLNRLLVSAVVPGSALEEITPSCPELLCITTCRTEELDWFVETVRPLVLRGLDFKHVLLFVRRPMEDEPLFGYSTGGYGPASNDDDAVATSDMSSKDSGVSASYPSPTPTTATVLPPSPPPSSNVTLAIPRPRPPQAVRLTIESTIGVDTLSITTNRVNAPSTIQVWSDPPSVPKLVSKRTHSLSTRMIEPSSMVRALSCEGRLVGAVDGSTCWTWSSCRQLLPAYGLHTHQLVVVTRDVWSWLQTHPTSVRFVEATASILEYCHRLWSHPSKYQSSSDQSGRWHSHRRWDPVFEQWTIVVYYSTRSHRSYRPTSQFIIPPNHSCVRLTDHSRFLGIQWKRSVSSSWSEFQLTRPRTINHQTSLDQQSPSSTRPSSRRIRCAYPTLMAWWNSVWIGGLDDCNGILVECKSLPPSSNEDDDDWVGIDWTTSDDPSIWTTSGRRVQCQSTITQSSLDRSTCILPCLPMFPFPIPTRYRSSIRISRRQFLRILTGYPISPCECH